MMSKPVKVQRETFVKDGKEYFGYFVSGIVRGKEVKAGVKPPDNGGYTVLDIVFDGAMEADLIVTPYTMKTEDGNVITGNTYAVQSIDEETGEIYSCKIKPSSDSSKSMLSMMFR